VDYSFDLTSGVDGKWNKLFDFKEYWGFSMFEVDQLAKTLATKSTKDVDTFVAISYGLANEFAAGTITESELWKIVTGNNVTPQPDLIQCATAYMNSTDFNACMKNQFIGV
jgi:hypothetical protein